jgi:hypothetical protein
MSKRGNFSSNRGRLKPDTNFNVGGIGLPEKEAKGTCSECGEETTIFPETGRCKECEIREIAKYLASQQP